MKTILGAAALALALPAGAAADAGFLVFTSSGVARYRIDAEDVLRPEGTLESGRIEEFAAHSGRVFRVDGLLGTVSLLGPDLRPVHQTKLPSPSGGPYWLGAWRGEPLLLAENEAVWLDASLRESGRRRLVPRRVGEIVPALAPVDFDDWEDRAYLLASTGEIFAFDLAPGVSSGAVTASARVEEDMTPLAQWIDERDRTLNVLGETRREEDGPQGAVRVIEEQVVLSFDLRNLAAAARRAVVHEERRIGRRAPLGRVDPEDHIVYERMPQDRKESERGTRIGAVSRGTPAFAEAYRPREDGFPERTLVRLGTLGRLEDAGLSSDLTETDLERRELRVLPPSYRRLRSLPELRSHAIWTLVF